MLRHCLFISRALYLPPSLDHSSQNVKPFSSPKALYRTQPIAIHSRRPISGSITASAALKSVTSSGSFDRPPPGSDLIRSSKQSGSGFRFSFALFLGCAATLLVLLSGGRRSAGNVGNLDIQSNPHISKR